MRTLLLASAAMVFGALSADAAPAIFYGVDAGAGPLDARPNSTAAFSSFSSAAAVASSLEAPITFETLTPGFSASMAVAPGVVVTITKADTSSPTASGIQTGNFSPATLGYNTTSGGSKFLQVAPDNNSQALTASNVTFSFAIPIGAFGAFFTGVGNSDGALAAFFDDGTSQTFGIAGASTGGVLFAGVVDAGQAFSSISFLEAILE